MVFDVFALAALKSATLVVLFAGIEVREHHLSAAMRTPKTHARREGGGGRSDVRAHCTDRAELRSFAASCAMRSYPSAIINIRSLMIGSRNLSARARHCSASRCHSALPRGVAILHLLWSLRANQSVRPLRKNPSAGAGVSLPPPLRETSNGSVLSITPANYRKLNTPRRLCGFACRAGKEIWENQIFFSAQVARTLFLAQVIAFARTHPRRNHRSFDVNQAEALIVWRFSSLLRPSPRRQQTCP
jgi:hypothetical protein